MRELGWFCDGRSIGTYGAALKREDWAEDEEGGEGSGTVDIMPAMLKMLRLFAGTKHDLWAKNQR